MYLNFIFYPGIFFLMFLAIGDKDFAQIRRQYRNSQVKNIPKNWTFLSTVAINVWIILGYTQQSFLALCQSFYRVVQEVFDHCLQALKASMWMYIQQQRLIYGLENFDFHSDFCGQLKRSVLTGFATWGQKRRFLNVLKLV